MSPRATATATATAALALAACASPAAPPPCERSLDGIWRTGQVADGEAIGWHFLDRGAAIEGYPTYRDVPPGLPPGVQAAPAAIDLERGLGGVRGRWSRRYELGGQRCVVAAPVRITRCAGRALTLELGPIAPPTDWSACAAPPTTAAMGQRPMPPDPITVELHR